MKLLARLDGVLWGSGEFWTTGACLDVADVLAFGML